MKLMVGEILDLVAAADTEDKKINILRANYSPAMEDVLRWSHDPTIVFFTDKIPPYTPDQSPEGLTMTTLYSEHKRFYMFARDAHIDNSRKTVLLIQMLEALGNKEASVLEQVIKKNLLVVSKNLAEKAYPGMFLKPVRVPVGS